MLHVKEFKDTYAVRDADKVDVHKDGEVITRTATKADADEYVKRAGKEK